MSFGFVTSVCVCEPRHVCTAATCFGFFTSVMSKMRTPRKRSALTAGSTPCVPQSSRPRVCSTDMTSRLPCTETSPCPPGQTIEASSFGFLGVGDIVDVEAVEVADEQVLAAEREVRVGEVQAAATRRRGRRGRLGGVSGLASGLASGLGFGFRARWVRRPASSGSKKPGGLGRLDTSSRLRAACPASFNPGLSPTRGSVEARWSASPAAPARRSRHRPARAPHPTRRHQPGRDSLHLSSSFATSSAFHACGRSPSADRRRRPTRTHKSPIPARRRRWSTAPSPSSARPRGA